MTLNVENLYILRYKDAELRMKVRILSRIINNMGSISSPKIHKMDVVLSFSHSPGSLCYKHESDSSLHFFELCFCFNHDEIFVLLESDCRL